MSDEQREFIEKQCKKGRYVMFGLREIPPSIQLTYRSLVRADRPWYTYCSVEPISPPPLPNLGNMCHMIALVQVLIQIPPIWRAYIRSRWGDSHPTPRLLPSTRDDLETIDSGERLRSFAYRFHTSMSKLCYYLSISGEIIHISRELSSLQQVMRGSDVHHSLYSIAPQSILEVFNRILSTVESDQSAIARAYKTCFFRYAMDETTISEPILLLSVVVDKELPVFDFQSLFVPPYRRDRFTLLFPLANFHSFGEYLLVAVEYGDISRRPLLDSTLTIGPQSFSVVGAVYSDESSLPRHFLAFIKFKELWYLANDHIISRVDGLKVAQSYPSYRPFLVVLKKEE